MYPKPRTSTDKWCSCSTETGELNYPNSILIHKSNIRVLSMMVRGLRVYDGGPAKSNLFALSTHVLSKNYDPHPKCTNTLTGQVSQLLPVDRPFMSSNYKTSRTLTGWTKCIRLLSGKLQRKTCCRHVVAIRLVLLCVTTKFYFARNGRTRQPSPGFLCIWHTYPTYIGYSVTLN